MRRRRVLVLAAATALPLLPLAPATAAPAPLLPLVPATAAPAPVRNALHIGQSLRTGEALVSPDGRFRAQLTHGRLVVTDRAGHRVWATPQSTPQTAGDAVLRVGRVGQMKLVSHHRNVWTAGTARSGRDEVLRIRDDGALALLGPGGLVWSDLHRNSCPQTRGRLFVVDVSRQAARACQGGQQIRFTRVTTGASSLHDGTPLGTWHVQAKVRDTTLYPAGGGAYPVRFWVPYNGAYGLHDAPWQHFPYGSAKYRQHGSHGCVHVPGPMMRWLFGWVRVGSTTVRIHA